MGQAARDAEHLTGDVRSVVAGSMKLIFDLVDEGGQHPPYDEAATADLSIEEGCYSFVRPFRVGRNGRFPLNDGR